MYFECPECNHELECHVVIGADQTMSGKTERLFLCPNCLSAWQVIGELCGGTFEIRRYFFG